jgi:iron complex transport system permease protein
MLNSLLTDQSIEGDSGDNQPAHHHQLGVGLPHMARWLVGADHRWSLPVTLLATPALLLFADVVGRLLVPGELRVSVVSAFIGAPVLIFLVRRKRGGSL